MIEPKITALEAVPVEVSGIRPFRISEGQATAHYSVIIRLLTDQSGLEGNAEVVSAPPGKPEEFLEEILGALKRYVAPVLVGHPAGERRAAMLAIDRALKGRIWTKAAVNVALYDLQAKLLAQPVSALLGGRITPDVPVIGPVIGIMSPDEMAGMAAEQSRQGYAAVKIKVGETVETDVARVQTVRDALGPGVRLRVDANDHYRPADAIRFIRAIERYDIEHVEQPLPRGDLLGMAEVKRATGIPIMTDDMVATAADAISIIRLNAADRVKVKVTKHGLDGASLLIGMLEAAGIQCVLGHVFEMGLAAVAEAQLAACCRNLAPPHEIGSLRPIGATDDIIIEELQPRPGHIRLPDGPGLGVTLDWARIERIRVGRAQQQSQ